MNRIAWSLLATLGLALCTALPAPADPLPTRVFAMLPLVEHAQLSPDGRRMAFQVSTEGKHAIVIADLLDPQAKKTVVPVPDQANVLWLSWVNGENLVAGLDTLQFVEGGDWYIRRDFAINAVTGKFIQLLGGLNGQNAGDIVWLPRDGSTKILMAGQNSIYEGIDFYPSVYQVDVADGSYHSFVPARGGIMDWMADPEGNVRIGVGYDDHNRTLRMMYRSTPHGALRTIEQADRRKDEHLMHPFLLLPGDHALVMHDDPEGRTGIYEVDLNTLADVRTVYDPPTDEVTGAILSNDGTTLLGVHTSSLAEPVHWFDEALAALQARFSRNLGDFHAAITSMSADGQRILISLTDANAPGALYLYDRRTEKLARLAEMNPVISMRHLAPVSLVHYKARDGLPIEAVLTLPEGRKPEHLPMVVLPHGGPWAQDRPEWDYWSQFLANRGYAVLQPNFRGSTGYGDEFLHKGDGQMGLAMQDDVTDGVRWAVAQGIADDKRVCIAGASYGGFAAMWGIVRDPDLYRCSIAIAGVSSLKREVNDFWHSTTANMSMDAWKRMTPDFDAVSPINAIDRIHVPLLLVHGRKDTTVDFEQSQRMYDRMHKAGKVVELVPIALADHYFERLEDRTALLSAMEAFLAKYNPAD
jgi:dipeptidyl aminopeptidase/acylaminoacyl peptidase